MGDLKYMNYWICGYEKDKCRKCNKKKIKGKHISFCPYIGLKYNDVKNWSNNK